jgi:hypothetical protein
VIVSWVCLLGLCAVCNCMAGSTMKGVMVVGLVFWAEVEMLIQRLI